MTQDEYLRQREAVFQALEQRKTHKGHPLTLTAARAWGKVGTVAAFVGALSIPAVCAVQGQTMSLGEMVAFATLCSMSISRVMEKVVLFSPRLEAPETGQQDVHNFYAAYPRMVDTLVGWMVSNGGEKFTLGDWAAVNDAHEKLARLTILAHHFKLDRGTERGSLEKATAARMQFDQQLAIAKQAQEIEQSTPHASAIKRPGRI